MHISSPAKQLLAQKFPRLWELLNLLRIRLRPQSVRGWMVTGNMRMARSDVSGAWTAWRRAIEASGHNPEIVVTVLSTLIGCGTSEEASAEVRAAWQRAIEETGQDSEVGVTLVRALIGYGVAIPGVPRAWAAWRRAIELTEDDPEIGATVVDLLMGRGATAEAIEAIQMILDRFCDSQPFLERLGRVLRKCPLGPIFASTFSRIRALQPAGASMRTCLGRYALEQGQIDQAVVEYESAIAVGSRDSLPWMHLGNLAFQLGDLDLSRQRLETARSLDPDSPWILCSLGITLLFSSQVEGAICLLDRCSRMDPVPGDTLLYLGMAYYARGEREQARALWTRHLELLGEDRERIHFLYVMLSTFGESHLANRSWLRHREILGINAISTTPAPRIFMTWWTRAIGHLTLLDICLKAQQLAGTTDHALPVIRFNPAMISNRFYLSCWSHWLRQEEVAAPDNPELMPGEEEVLFPPMVPCRGRPGVGFYQAAGAIQQDWEQLGRTALLKLPEEIQRRGWKLLEQLGVAPGQWFVTLHVREAGFKQYDVGFSHRNADLERFLPAVDAIIQRGGAVIRLGSPHMRPAPIRKGLIEYAHSDLRSNWMDVFLCAEGLFHIGVPSGISHVPVTFHRPTLFTNWAFWDYPPWFGGDLMLPKLFQSTVDGEIMSLRDILETGLGSPTYSFFLTGRGLRWIDSSAEDIRDAALEMLDRTQGQAQKPTPEENRMQEQIRALLAQHGVVMNCNLARGFLRRQYSALMPQIAARRGEETLGKPSKMGCN